MNFQKLLRHRRRSFCTLRQQSPKPVLRGFVDDAVDRVGAGETDVTGVAGGREQVGGELGGKVQRGAWRGVGSESGGCVQVKAASLLGEVALG